MKSFKIRQKNGEHTKIHHNNEKKHLDHIKHLESKVNYLTDSVLELEEQLKFYRNSENQEKLRKENEIKKQNLISKKLEIEKLKKENLNRIEKERLNQIEIKRLEQEKLEQIEKLEKEQIEIKRLEKEKLEQIEIK